LDRIGKQRIKLSHDSSYVMKKTNEDNACNAFIKILKNIKGVEYEKKNSPDEENHAFPDVDFILVSKDGHSHKIAVEHTIVESFENQIIYVNQSYDVVREINVQCQGKLPKDRYYFLVVPNLIVESLASGRKKQFVKETSSWISYNAKNLMLEQQLQREYNSQKITLWCRGSHPKMNGNIHRIPEQPKEAEKLTRERFRRAISDKLPKLVKYKLKGITTSLLLEDISGIFWDPHKRWRDLSLGQRFRIRIFVDYIIIFMSNQKEMIVGNVWKEKWRLYSIIPDDRKFDLSDE
jgi:hypothetical protein